MLFPDLKAKESQASADSSTTSSGVGAQITGYSHRQLLFDGEMNAFAGGGPSVDDAGKKMLQREVAAVDQVIVTQERSPATAMADGSGGLTSQMTTFKPIVQGNLRPHQVGRILGVDSPVCKSFLPHCSAQA